MEALNGVPPTDEVGAAVERIKGVLEAVGDEFDEEEDDTLSIGDGSVEEDEGEEEEEEEEEAEEAEEEEEISPEGASSEESHETH
jgi:hypothetical protein